MSVSEIIAMNNTIIIRNKEPYFKFISRINMKSQIYSFGNRNLGLIRKRVLQTAIFLENEDWICSFVSLWLEAWLSTIWIQIRSYCCWEKLGKSFICKSVLEYTIYGVGLQLCVPNWRGKHSFSQCSGTMLAPKNSKIILQPWKTYLTTQQIY